MSYHANYDDILRIYPALLEFSRFKLPVKKAWTVWRMLSDMKVRFDFFCAEELKLAVKYAVCVDGKPVVTKGGQINFSSDGKRREYEREIADLKNGDAGELETIELYFSEIGDQFMSPDVIWKIRPVVVIKEDVGDDK